MAGVEECRLGWTGALPFDHYPLFQGSELGVFNQTLDLHPISSPVAEAGVGEPLLQATVLSEDQKPLAVGIQSAGCIHIRHINPVGQTPPTASGLSGELTENPEGLMEQQGQE